MTAGLSAAVRVGHLDDNELSVVLEIGLGLLKMRLACGPYLVGTRNQRPDRSLGKCDCTDERHCREGRRRRKPAEENERRSVEQACRRRGLHRIGSRIESMSLRKLAPSIGGSVARRATSSAMGTARRRNGRSSATSAPSRVTISDSPPVTRFSTSPPWLRSSRTQTASMTWVYHRWDRREQSGLSRKQLVRWVCKQLLYRIGQFGNRPPSVQFKTCASSEQRP